MQITGGKQSVAEFGVRVHLPCYVVVFDLTSGNNCESSSAAVPCSKPAKYY